MLIGTTGTPFEDADYIYELKYDGERGIIYLDSAGSELRNKRNRRMQQVFPELAELHKQVKGQVILDGEYICLINGKPNFSAVQRRSLLTHDFKIKMAAKETPISFICFDILYANGKDLMGLPLMERKELLQKAVIADERIAISAVFESGCADLFDLTRQQGLEGIVAKRRDSLYHQGKKTRKWIKIKNMMDDEFIICGWVPKQHNMNSIILGKYSQAGKLLYKGHVQVGINTFDFSLIKACSPTWPPFNSVPVGNENAIWVMPQLVCTVEFMEYTNNGSMRQAVFKGIRPDKRPEEVIEILNA